MRDEDPAGQLEDRREELEQAQGGQGQAVGAGREADQRDHRHQSGAGQQRGHVPGGVAEDRLVRALQVDQVAERGQELEAGLHGHRRDGRHRGQLLAQAVDAEGRGQDEGDPRGTAVCHGQFDHRDRPDAHGQPLGPAQALVQDEHAEEDCEQGIDEVAERGFHHLAGVDRPDVETPVDRDEHRAGAEQRDLPRLGPQLGQPAPVLPHGQKDQDQHQGPSHPVGQDLQCPGRFHQRPVEGEQPPQAVGNDPEYQSALLFCHSRKTIGGLTGWQRPIADEWLVGLSAGRCVSALPTPRCPGGAARRTGWTWPGSPPSRRPCRRPASVRRARSRGWRGGRGRPG